MIDWLLEASPRDVNPMHIVDRELGLSFAAIHTTAKHMTNVIYDLAFHWDEYAPELIEEYRDALKQTGGVLQKTTVTKLSKLDSFMKESQRLNPPSCSKCISLWVLGIVNSKCSVVAR
jgi:ent-kaurene oxidase